MARRPGQILSRVVTPLAGASLAWACLVPKYYGESEAQGGAAGGGAFDEGGSGGEARGGVAAGGGSQAGGSAGSAGANGSGTGGSSGGGSGSGGSAGGGSGSDSGGLGGRAGSGSGGGGGSGMGGVFAGAGHRGGGAAGEGGRAAESGGGGGSGASGGTPSGGAGIGGAGWGGEGAAPNGGRPSGGGGAGGQGMGGTGTGGEATGGTGTGGGAPETGGAHNSTPSSGCSVTDVTTGTTIDNTMNVPGQSTPREYRLSVPTDYVPGEPLPVVFVLNGVGGTGPQAQQFFQVETGHRAIFVYPTSLPNDEAGGSIAWDFDRNGVDVPFFDAMVSYIEENYCVDTSRIFVLGASSGGIMSNMLGCFRGDVVRAIAPSSGMTWQQSGCQGDVAVMVICGEQDTFNPCDDGQNGGLSQTNVWVPLNGCTQQQSPSPISEICQEFQDCRADDPLLLCRHPRGHGWPTSNGDFWWQFFMSLE